MSHCCSSLICPCETICHMHLIRPRHARPSGTFGPAQKGILPSSNGFFYQPGHELHFHLGTQGKCRENLSGTSIIMDRVLHFLSLTVHRALTKHNRLSARYIDLPHLWHLPSSCLLQAPYVSVKTKRVRAEPNTFKALCNTQIVQEAASSTENCGKET